jgi:peptidoglycan hydrolase CwlO-like protein
MEIRNREDLQAIVDKRNSEITKTIEELQADVDKRLQEIKERDEKMAKTYL